MGNNQCPQCRNQFSGILCRLSRRVFNTDIMEEDVGVVITGSLIGGIYALYLRDPSQSWDNNLTLTLMENEELVHIILEWIYQHNYEKLTTPL